MYAKNIFRRKEKQNSEQPQRPSDIKHLPGGYHRPSTPKDTIALQFSSGNKDNYNLKHQV